MVHDGGDCDSYYSGCFTQCNSLETFWKVKEERFKEVFVFPSDDHDVLKFLTHSLDAEKSKLPEGEVSH